MAYSLAPNIKSRFFITGTNRPLAGGLLYTYLAGTTTNAATYSDNLGTPNTNPVVLDADGQCNLFLDDNVSYRIILKNSAGVTQFDQDRVASISSAQVAALAVTVAETAANVVSTAADVATSLLNITTANNLLSAALVSSSYATIALGLAGVATNAIFLVRPNSTDSLTRFTWYTKTGASTYTLLASAVTGAEFDATGIAGIILPLPIEVLPEGMRFRIANRLYADFNATTGFTFYKATLAASKTYLDDQPTVAIEDRVFGAALGTMFSALPDELGGVMRFRWGNRLLAEWDMTYGFKPSKMMIPSTAVIADSPTIPLTQRLVPAVDTTAIYAWGDSRTAGAGDVYPFRFPEYLATLVSPTTVSTQAIGGQTSIMIAARHGGWPLLLSVTSDTIPASGAVTVTAYSTDIFNSSGTPLTAGSHVGTLAGIAGTYTSDGAGGLTFTRTTAGSATVIEKYSPFIPDTGSTNRNKINFICIGTNNAGTDSITGAVGSTYDNVMYCKAMVDYVLTGGGLPIVAGVIDNVPTGTANTVDCAALNNQYKSIFGRYYVDFFRPPTAEELATANTGVGSTYTFTANDNIDIAAGKWPRGLYADSVHFLRHGQYIQALRVHRHLIRLGIIT